MIENILPLSELKLRVLAELYQKDSTLTSLEIKTGSLKQTVFKVLKSLNEVLDKNNNVYSIKSEYKLLLKEILNQKLLEIRFEDKYILLSLIKKYYKPEKVILFGSCARGEMTKTSDIDIYVISEISEKENLDYRLKFSSSLGIDIQIISVNSKNQNLNNKYKELYDKITNNISEGIVVNLDLIV